MGISIIRRELCLPIAFMPLCEEIRRYSDERSYCKRKRQLDREIVITYERLCIKYLTLASYSNTPLVKHRSTNPYPAQSTKKPTYSNTPQAKEL
jgi:hypothetical protein